jgi:hypothetical protein
VSNPLRKLRGEIRVRVSDHEGFGRRQEVSEQALCKSRISGRALNTHDKALGPQTRGEAREQQRALSGTRRSVYAEDEWRQSDEGRELRHLGIAPRKCVRMLVGSEQRVRFCG